ncbi:hypothetical protein H109_00584 [Trichophyton interdigitale MR816]|uniref:Uncharacterized protein n=1 Tax=Trichophyton interdigitale (strain MR816) TaxID=1215338 RepID=A0A059JIL5_TRIIM|nr:hypothetical protein H109_00584 [Trichophyton interdigitale MR816]
MRASVNSFGFGGANAHAILESYEPVESHMHCGNTSLFTPLTFSAHSEKSLRGMLDAFSSFLSLENSLDVSDIAWTLQKRRSTLAYKIAISGRSTTNIVATINAARNQKEGLGVRSSGPEKLTVLGVFTSQGAQWPTMGSELIKASAHELPKADRPSWSIREELEADKRFSRLSEAALAQPLCTAVQIVLVDLLKAAGTNLEFKAVIGHSSGEIAAAYASGFISARDAIRVAYYRGLYAKFAGSSSGKKGAMMAVGTTLEDAEEFCQLEEFHGRITVAASNAATSVTLSGDEDAIDAALVVFKDESKFVRKLRVDTAYHSFHMNACSEMYLKAMDSCSIEFRGGNPSISWYSSVIPDTNMACANLNGQYWADNMNNTVLFSQAGITAVKESGPFDLVIEIGPHPALKGPCLENLEQATGVGGTPYTGLLSRGVDDVKAFSAALGYIWEYFGPSAVDFEGYDKVMSSGAQRNNLSGELPGYSWDHSRTYWLDSRVATSYTTREAPHPMLGVNVVEGTTETQIQWRNILFPKEITWIPGHRLQGQNVFPASGYVCMAIEAIMTLASNRDVQLIELEDVDIARAISFLDDTTGIELIFTLNVLSSEHDAVSASFQISSCPKGDNVLTLNGKGKISLRFGDPVVNALSTSLMPQFNMTSVDIDRFYKYLSDMGYNYSPPFKAISSILRRKDAAVGEITDARGEAWEDNFLMHPGFVDTSFQAVFAAFSSPGDDRLWSIHVPTKINRLSINPSLAVFPPGEEIVWPWQAAVTSGTHDTPTADIEVFAPNKSGVLMEIEGIVLVPLAKASGENDVKLFSNLIYDLAQPDGAIASPHRLPESDAHIARVSERFTFYWINQLLNTITTKEEEETLPHFKHMLRWCRFVHKQVIDGSTPLLDLTLAVGQNIAHVIRTRGNIHEYALKDNILDRFYEEAIGLDITNQWEANLAAQIAYRYPRMNLLKSVRAFSTYTFTDISSGFFEAAEERFSKYADRMIFKTLDMEKDLSEQGFTEGHYDMVLASNVLHVGPDIDLTLSNVRKLVKPGGWLINMEVATHFPSLREGFSMSGFPGWWYGAETGRPWGPTITVEEWDKVYRRTGWSGVDTFTPNIDSIDHLVVMVTQAVDSQIYTLRDPLSPEHAHPQRENLVIIGGSTDEVAGIVTECTNILRPHFSSISNVISIDEFSKSESDAAATVLNLAELDVPIMKELMDNQPQKLYGVKEVFSTPREILWVTKGNRSESPFSRMLAGMARTLRREYSGINFQALDVDVLDSNSAKLFAETLLRHLNLNEANSRLVPGSILWSDESEYHLENNKIYTPRLMSADKLNDRYNSYKRRITHEVPANSSSIELTMKGDSYGLLESSPLKPTAGSDGDSEITVMKSLLQSVEVPLVGHFFLCYGKNNSGESVIALSDQSKSVVHIPKPWTIPYTGEANPAQVLLSIASSLIVHLIIEDAATNSTILVHEPDQIVAAAISKQAASKKIRAFFTTTQTSKKGPQWTYIHPKTPRRLLRKQLPKGVSLFINFSNFSEEQAISNLVGCLPVCCKQSNRYMFFGNSVAKRLGSDVELVSKYLSTGFDISKTANFMVSDNRSTLPLDKVPGYSDKNKRLLVVDWAVHTQIPLTVEPIDPYVNLFSAEKTYLMVGLSGEMGQSLAEWMISRGARYVVLTSRRPKVNAEWIESMEDEYGATIKQMPLDITDADALQACYNKICRTMPPIGGVAHGAMVLVDSLQLDDCDEFFIGVADANRTDDKFINTLGFFLNLLPVRFERYAAEKFGDAVQQVRNKVYKGLAHSKLPFDILPDELNVPRSATSTPIFQVFVDYRQGVEEKQKYMGLDAVGEKWHLARTGYDMTLDIVENATGDTRLELRLQKCLYTAKHTKLLLEGYVNLLMAFADSPAVDWNAPDVWDSKTINDAIEVGRGPSLQYEWAPTVMHHIDDVVSQHGTNICLKDGTGKIMTYSQMARRVNSICSALVTANVTEGDKVAVFQQPTADWVYSLLAIFRAGAVYVPLDLRTPFPRLATIVDQIRPQAILAHSQTLGDMEHINTSASAVVDITNLPTNSPFMPNLAKPGAPAVILFTSGSTGTPKGININHSNIVKQLEGCSKQFDLKSSAFYVLHQTAYSFDKSLEQIFTALVHGGALYVVPAEQRGDPISITNIMALEGITHTATTPSEYLMWLHYARDNLLKCKSWKCALLGGEVASNAVLEEFRKLGMPIRLLDSYGPTEITMSCAKVELPYRSMVIGTQAPVGFMLPNYSVAIVDPKMNTLPLGFSGEIVIGGVGVAGDYLNNDELTRQKFIPNNFGGEGMVYRTGDKGRLTEEGALFFEGRIDGDTQIKLRGVRIELEDIESTILQASAGALTHAVVTVRGEQDSAFLVAHVVFSTTYTEYRDELLARLPTILPLPQYMIPTSFVALDNVPFTAHFKVDRKAVQALPIPEAEKKSIEELTEQTETETHLAGLWNQIFPTTRSLTPSSDFFHAGGNSLMLVKLQAMIRQSFSVSIQLFDIMNAGTLQNMARLIDDALGVKELDWTAETDLPTLPKSNADLSSPKQKDMVVMMTGATGVLGRNVLAHLVADDRISKIYTLAVRPQSDISTLTRIPDPKGKMVIKHGSLDKALLGLSEKEAMLLSSEIDAIPHLGANRSFWDSYYHLRATNVSSVKEIVKIAYPRKVPVHFCSSGGVTMYSGCFPPANGHDGYIASKWAAEKVLANATQELDLRVVLHRPAKASGATTNVPDEIINELLSLASTVPLERIAGDIARSLFDENVKLGHPEVLTHSSSLNVSIKDFADKITQDKAVSKLEGMPPLKWMGLAKKMGWSQFMVGHEISMNNSKDHIVSTR